MFSISMAAPSFFTLASEWYQHPHNLSRAWRGVKCTTDRDVGRSTIYSLPNLEMENAKATRSGSVIHKTLGEKMRHGGLERDNLVYNERFIVRSSQIGVNKTATIEAISSLLQVIDLCSLCKYNNLNETLR